MDSDASLERERLTPDAARGACCADCTTYFVEAHGYPVVCSSCANTYSRKELDRLQLRRATHRPA